MACAFLLSTVRQQLQKLIQPIRTVQVITCPYRLYTSFRCVTLYCGDVIDDEADKLIGANLNKEDCELFVV